MKPFEPFPQCIDCLVGLAHTASSLVAEEDAGLKKARYYEQRAVFLNQ